MPGIDVFPLEPWAVVTSPFGPRGGRNHNGTDYGSPNPGQRSINGTPVRAPFAGTVTVGNEPGGAGQWSWVTADDGRALFKSFHHSRYEVTRGHVEAGDVIAYVGATGASQGAHAHLELWVNGRPIDPQPHLEAARNRPVPAPPASPVPEEDTVTPEQMATIGQWMQEQRALTDARIADLEAKVNVLLLQLDPAGVAAGKALEPSEPYARQLIERIINKTGA